MLEAGATPQDSTADAAAGDAAQPATAEGLPSDPRPADGSPAEVSAPQVPVQAPRFAELQPAFSGDGASLDRFYDVSVTVSAELGRVSMALGELLKMGDGSVVKLDRPVTAPVELMAQGVRVAWGEVVVVDDCFAIRVKEIERTRKGA